MNKTKFDAYGRSMRWYEWLAALLLLGLAAGVRAESVYKCTNAQGGVAYQAQPCSGSQHEARVSIDPAPTYTPPPQYAVERRSGNTSARRSTASRRPTGHEATSYECRASDGEVFYRHGSCPHSITAKDDGARGRGRGRGQTAKASISVSAHPIPRDEACTQMRRAGSIGRAGHEHDESISTYERNLGRDPCE
jgi:hypothetical protein